VEAQKAPRILEKRRLSRREDSPKRRRGGKILKERR
jgi:hypothetical protein